MEDGGKGKWRMENGNGQWEIPIAYLKTQIISPTAQILNLHLTSSILHHPC